MIQIKDFYVKSFLLALILVSLSSCTEMWGSRDDPADPKSDNYQGYETIKDPDAIAPVETHSGIVAYVPKLLATKVDGATAYQFRVSATSDPESYLYESVEVTGNEYLPVDCHGLSTTTTYYWFVRAKVEGTWGAWSSETATFSLSAAEPDTASPANSSTITDTTPAFDWSDVAGAVGYRSQISAANDFMKTVTDDATLTMSAYTQAALTNEATYYWRFMAKNADGVWNAWTTARSFTVSTERPSLVTPSDASTISDTTPTFDWTDVTGAAGYRIQIAAVSDFTTTVTDDATLTVSSYTQATALTNEATYYWRVVAKNADGVWNAWTSYRSFTVVTERPSLSTPSDASTITDTTPAFDWPDVAGAAGYRIQISAASDFATTMTDDATLTVSSYTQAAALANEATYYWRVMAKNMDGVWSAWTESRNFTVNFGAISVLYPLSGGATSDNTPLLNWANAPDAVSYLVQTATSEGGLTATSEVVAISSEYETVETLAVGDIRWWRVSAVNANGQRGSWSAIAYFTIVPTPDPPLLLSPADVSSVTIARPVFNWMAVEGAVSYEIVIATSEVGLEDATSLPVSGTSWIPTSDLVVGSWYWRVRCLDAYGVMGEWSGAWSLERPYFSGDTGPAGGKVFYDKGDFSSGWRYLEAAPSTQSNGIVWYNGSFVNTGATGISIGTGEANTAAIVSVQGAGDYAASLCANLSLGGYDDWFLPSRFELSVIYGQMGVIGYLEPGYYWSSSEYSSNSAWNIDSGSGIHGYWAKTSVLRVLAIRAF